MGGREKEPFYPVPIDQGLEGKGREHACQSDGRDGMPGKKYRSALQLSNITMKRQLACLHWIIGCPIVTGSFTTTLPLRNPHQQVSTIDFQSSFRSNFVVSFFSRSVLLAHLPSNAISSVRLTCVLWALGPQPYINRYGG